MIKVGLRLLTLLVAGLVAGSGCIYGTSEPWLGDAPQPALESTATTPEGGASGVPRNGAVVFQFDDRVHPDSVGVDTLALTSGQNSVDAARQVDLLACTVSLAPQSLLTADLSYQAEASGLYGFGRGPLAEPVLVGFTTGSTTVDATPPAVVTTEEIVREVLVPRCASCHDDHYPPGGLSLTSEDAVNATLLDQDSAQRPGSPRVSRGSHARSYLMWKVLGLPGIAGEPMPAGGDWAGGRQCGTPDPDLARLARWIDGL